MSLQGKATATHGSRRTQKLRIVLDFSASDAAGRPAATPRITPSADGLAVVVGP